MWVWQTKTREGVGAAPACVDCAAAGLCGSYHAKVRAISPFARAVYLTNTFAAQVGEHTCYNHDIVKTTDWCTADPHAAGRARAMAGHTTIRKGTGSL